MDRKDEVSSLLTYLLQKQDSVTGWDHDDWGLYRSLIPEIYGHLSPEGRKEQDAYNLEMQRIVVDCVDRIASTGQAVPEDLKARVEEFRKTLRHHPLGRN